ncbi:hypothetical protein J5N97_016132 [Dioscorea zingiberensis]|uniref:Bifunctional inhibitor/plant lipid transfer protein/seed storage helical domain-containing protein n=1 Tax=Dioscorea zingiberensis TaxID=325984 RepID=A0A9D5CJ69_9LILI|nr:hypothetical protein J5N97_016132 [Dioscorea zingiberensis]
MATSSSLLHPNLIQFILIFFSFVVNLTLSDFAGDQSECGEQLVGLAGCLPYVQGSAKAPTPDCCTGLKEVLEKSPKCLCVLIKDRDDPQLGLEINVTLAVSLPSACATHANISECPKLLNLKPDSKDAKMFKQLAQAQGSAARDTGNTTASVGSSSSPSKHAANSGGMSIHSGGGTWWHLGVEMILLVLPLILFDL